MKLEGIRVVDLSLFLPGPHLTMTMSDHGAEVIKVEPPGEGDPARHLGPFAGGTSVWFRATNRGKKSVVLDLKDPAGRDALLALAETADVFLEAFRPGVARRLGVDYEAVAARNPRIVYCSISAFGQEGPDARRPVHNLGVEALAGTVSLAVGNDGTPMNPHVPVADATASLTALSGILMALLRRERTGRGDHLDVALLDSTLAWLPNIVGPVFAEDRPPAPLAERSSGGLAFSRVYETSDGRHVVLSGAERKFVEALLSALGRPDLVDAAMGPPGEGQRPVRAFLEATFRSRTRAAWEAWFEGREVGFAPVLDLREAFRRPAVEARGMLVRDRDGNLHIGLPLRFREEPGRLDPSVPGLGEHTAEVLATLPGPPD